MEFDVNELLQLEQGLSYITKKEGMDGITSMEVFDLSEEVSEQLKPFKQSREKLLQELGELVNANTGEYVIKEQEKIDKYNEEILKMSKKKYKINTEITFTKHSFVKVKDMTPDFFKVMKILFTKLQETGN